MDNTAGHYPVEGALVGLVSQKTHRKYPVSDSLSWQSQFRLLRDLAFAHGVTNRSGQATLIFTTSYEDSLTITAVHNDYYSGRKNISVGDSNAVEMTYDVNIFSGSLAPLRTGEAPLIGPGAFVNLVVVMKNVSSTTLDSVKDTFMIVNVPQQDGIYARMIPKYSEIPTTLAPGETRTSSFYFTVDSCPEGESSLPIQLEYSSTNQHNGSTIINVPVVGPKVIPVINYLVDNDSNFVPDGGNNVRVHILLGNRYPVAAKDVSCKLVTLDPNITVYDSLTSVIPLVYPDSSCMDTSIYYTIGGGYSEDDDGIIQAKLVVSGSNIKSDTISIDLNPMRNLDLKIDTNSVAVDYKGGVFS